MYLTMLSTITYSVLLSVVAALWVPQSQTPLISKKKIISDIPSIGLGLWNAKDKSATDAVGTAFSDGYRHLDSAAAYGNEKFVGDALKNEKKLSRSDYWITSKLWNTDHRPGNVAKALNKTLSDLGVDYLDLYLMHWPVAFVPDKPGRNVVDQDTSITDTWLAMEALVSQNRTHPEPGTARFIGISNFSPRQIDEVMQKCATCPYAHEFETHPWLQQQEFVDWHHKHDIKVIAYSPLANLNPTYKEKFPKLPLIIDDPFFVELAATKNATAAQIILAWNLARNVVVIPKSVHPNYIQENLDAVKIKLNETDMKAIMEQEKRTRFNNPSKEWGVQLFESLDGGSNRFF